MPWLTIRYFKFGGSAVTIKLGQVVVESQSRVNVRDSVERQPHFDSGAQGLAECT